MEPTKKKISEEERQKQLKIWDANFVEGRKVFIRLEPKNAIKEGFALGTIHTIVPPPKNHLNTAMGVWLKNKVGKTVCLSFAYTGYLPEGVNKVDISKLEKKPVEYVKPKIYTEELEQDLELFEAVVSVAKAVDAKIVRKRTVEPVVVRRRRIR